MPPSLRSRTMRWSRTSPAIWWPGRLLQGSHAPHPTIRSITAATRSRKWYSSNRTAQKRNSWTNCTAARPNQRRPIAATPLTRAKALRAEPYSSPWTARQRPSSRLQLSPTTRGSSRESSRSAGCSFSPTALATRWPAGRSRTFTIRKGITLRSSSTILLVAG